MKHALTALLIVGFVSGCTTLQDVGRQLYGNSGASGRNNPPVEQVKEPTLRETVLGIEPVRRELTLREKVVGTYQMRVPNGFYSILTIQLLKDGRAEMEQATGAGEKKSESGTWKIEDGNVVVAGEDTSIMKVVPNGDLTMITVINNGKRIDIPKENQTPIRKIPVKELTPEQKQREALRDSVLGEYEYTYDDGGKDKWVFLENGTIDSYSYDKLTSRLSYVMVNIYEWSIVDGEIHLKQDDREINVLRINADKSITWIAMIEDGKRKDYPKETQSTRKKIK